MQYSTFQHKNVEYEKFSTFVGAFSVENHVENVENSWFYRYLQDVENFILQRKSTIQAKKRQLLGTNTHENVTNILTYKLVC